MVWILCSDDTKAILPTLVSVPSAGGVGSSEGGGAAGGGDGLAHPLANVTTIAISTRSANNLALFELILLKAFAAS